MRWSAILFSASLAAAGLVTGCGSDHGMDHGSASPSPENDVFRAHEARERAHHQVALTSTDPVDLRAETARYAADMDSLMDDMRAMCEQMGDSMMAGMMEMMGGGMGSMHEGMDRMRDSIHLHHARMDTISSLESMRGECEGHYVTMMRMMGDMGDGVGHDGHH